jgi:hypothetical protein
MSVAAQRAKHLGSQKEIRDWVRRFRDLAQTMPKDVWVFVASGTPNVMAKGEDGRIFERGGGRPGDAGVEQDAVITSVSGGRWDGGDW